MEPVCGGLPHKLTSMLLGLLSGTRPPSQSPAPAAQGDHRACKRARMVSHKRRLLMMLVMEVRHPSCAALRWCCAVLCCVRLSALSVLSVSLNVLRAVSEHLPKRASVSCPAGV
jgi:hypothetical protein